MKQKRKREFFVAGQSSGRQEGSQRYPFQNLEQVWEVLQSEQKSREQSAAPDVKIWLREGCYRQEKPLLLETGMFASLSLCAWEGERAEVTGTRLLNPEWEPCGDGIYRAQLEKRMTFDGLFVNGKRQTLCRYPKERKGEILDGYTTQEDLWERAGNWKHPEGGYVRALHESDWGGNSYRILGKNEDGSLNLQWVGDNNRGKHWNPQKMMAENIREELTCEGEWFYESSSGILYFCPPKELCMETAVWEAAVCETLLHIRGTDAAHPVRNIRIEGISFGMTARTMFSRPYERPLRGDWAIQRTGAILLENAEQVRIEHCRFHDCGSNALFFSGYQKDHVVCRSDLTQIGASGVLICGEVCAVRDASFWDGSQHKTEITDWQPGPKTEDYPRDIVIADNYFTENGLFEKQSAGVSISIAERIRVSGNTIHHMPRAGINMSDGCFGGHIIEKNDLFDCVRETGDHGPLNAWGRDRFWSLGGFDTSGKGGERKRHAARLDARSTNLIRWNRIHALHGFGIDLDDGASNYEIYQNLCLGAGIKTREGFDRIVHDNVLVGCPFEVHVSYAMNRDLFYHNIVYYSQPFHYICLNEGHTTIITDNLYWNGGSPVTEIEEWENAYCIADPHFIDPARNLYTVADDSAALQMGFAPFSMEDSDFGRADRPKPPAYLYHPVDTEQKSCLLEKMTLTDVRGEGMKSTAGLSEETGAMIVSLPALSLFERYGFRVSDVILEWNGKVVTDSGQCARLYQVIVPGTEVQARIFRNQREEIIRFWKEKGKEDVPAGKEENK